MSHEPISLLAAFSPPEGYTSDFGWICGFSADAHFLDGAAERFTGYSRSQRAREGRSWLGVMLDRSTPQVPVSVAPGVLHLPARGPLPYKLLHLKVALLSFSSSEGGWLLRLLVSTGNWTRQTLVSSLDLHWTLDLASSELSARQAVSDIRAAADLLLELRPLFADEALVQPQRGVARQTAAAVARLGQRLKMLASSRGDPSPRFFDNRRASLAEQLPEQVRTHAGDKRRNHIVLGSGFFESGQLRVVSRVLELLRATDQGKALLTASADVALVVNPSACQGVARSSAAIAAAPWRVLAASDPWGARGRTRSLHAKFVFSANCHDDGENAASPWLYLGSGNLTQGGFGHRAGREGNLEAGVVFAPSGVSWANLGEHLPVDLDGDDLATSPEELGTGEEAPERIVAFVAPPFPYLVHTEQDASFLCPPPGSPPPPDELALRGPDNQRTLFAEGRFPWPWPTPAEVDLHWSHEGVARHARVPVLDAAGRLGGRALPPLDFDGLDQELGSFPHPPDDESDELDESEQEETSPKGKGRGGHPSRYPIRTMMRGIELVAERQVQRTPEDWDAWCTRLEQALLRMKESPTVAAVRALGINALAPLRRAEFRPSFAEGGTGEAARRYEETLARVEQAWGYQETSPLGGDQ